MRQSRINSQIAFGNTHWYVPVLLFLCQCIATLNFCSLAPHVVCTRSSTAAAWQSCITNDTKVALSLCAAASFSSSSSFAADPAYADVAPPASCSFVEALHDIHRPAASLYVVHGRFEVFEVVAAARHFDVVAVVAPACRRCALQRIDDCNNDD